MADIFVKLPQGNQKLLLHFFTLKFIIFIIVTSAFVYEIVYKQLIFLHTPSFIGSWLVLFSMAYISSTRKFKNWVFKLFSKKKEKPDFFFIHNPTPEWIYDFKTLQIVAVNLAAINIYGYSKEEFLKMHMQDLVTEEERKRLENTPFMLDQNVIEEEYWQHKKKDNAILEVKVNYSDIYYLKKKARFIAINDVTQKNKALRELHLSEQNFKALAENMPDTLTRVDKKLNIVYTNKKVEIIGIYPDYLKSKKQRKGDVAFEETLEWKNKIKEVFKTNKAVKHQLSVETLHGTQYYDCLFVPEHDLQGDVNSVLTTVRDITDIIEINKELERINEELEITNRYLNDFKKAVYISTLVSILDKNGKIKEVNEELCVLSGYDKAELIDSSLQDFIDERYHPEDFAKEIWKTISEGNIWRGEIRSKTKNDGYYWIYANIVPFMDEKGNPYQYLSINIDITTQKQDREELLMSHIELDQFVYRASHDIRGPLARQMSICTVAMMESKDPIALGYFDIMFKTAKKMDDILCRLLNINNIKKKHLEFKEVSIESLLEDILLNVDSPIPIKIETNIPHHLKTYTDEYLLKLTLTHLIENCMQFHDKGKGDQSYVEIKVQETHDNKVKFTVKDNGIGIPLAISEKIFTMFFRGTDASTGSGLGLYTSKTAVQRLAGTIKLNTEEQLLTVFEVTIPNGEIKTPYKLL